MCYQNVVRTAAMMALMAGIPAGAGDLRNARVAAGPDLTKREKKAVEMLVGEVQARTGLLWPTATAGLSGQPVITVRHASGAGPAEGFRVTQSGTGIEIQGNDERGTLFGVGRFLRELRWSIGAVEIPDGFNFTSSPKYRLRGHQIGYRPKVNTYDAWTPAIFEQYVRDMAVFGTNAVELIPPRSDDDDPSPHFPLPKLEMMIEMSRILDEYGLQVWIWYPAMDHDYTKPETVEFALKEWGEIFRKLPRIDAILVPGGDPGETRPKVLMDLLEKEAGVLRQAHPRAQMWVSPQNFNVEWLDEFVGVVKNEPKWLDGIVYGPWTRVTLPELRARIPARYPIRRYPDITHSIHSEYPVPGWDTAYAVTEGRETINPRPIDQTKIFRLTSPHSIGFITYSEGVNDDVNKFVWSSLGWDPDADVYQILGEYARYFISARFEDEVAQSLLALERNWRGPLLTNAGVDVTLEQAQALERAATPQMLLNWRFQQILYRAYYDGYVRQRLIHETWLEKQALDRLGEAGRTGSLAAMDRAAAILDQVVEQPTGGALRTRLIALAEALYQSIRMQLSVDRYRAVAVSRGANLDNIDFPLNNRFWLKKKFAEVRALNSEDERMTAIEAILNRANPGPGGFYDDLGNTAMQPHLVDEGPGYDKDPGSFRSPRSGWTAFSGGLIGRTSRDAIRPDGPARFMETPSSWWNYVESRYETPLTLRYERLDATANYRIRVVYIGRATSPKVRLVANDGIEIHPYIARPFPTRPLEFDVPREAVRGGKLTLRWSTESGLGGFSGAVNIAEVFLLRK